MGNNRYNITLIQRTGNLQEKSESFHCWLPALLTPNFPSRFSRFRISRCGGSYSWYQGISILEFSDINYWACHMTFYWLLTFDLYSLLGGAAPRMPLIQKRGFILNIHKSSSLQNEYAIMFCIINLSWRNIDMIRHQCYFNTYSFCPYVEMQQRKINDTATVNW